MTRSNGSFVHEKKKREKKKEKGVRYERKTYPFPKQVKKKKKTTTPKNTARNPTKKKKNEVSTPSYRVPLFSFSFSLEYVS
jgi:hypothetical protein